MRDTLNTAMNAVNGFGTNAVKLSTYMCKHPKEVFGIFFAAMTPSLARYQRIHFSSTR